MRPPIALRSLGLLAVGSCLALSAGRARAQSHARVDAHTTVMLSATPNSVAAAERVAESVERALQDSGQALLSAASARERLQALSRPPAAADVSDLDVLAEQAHKALEHVAFGRSAAARRSVQEVLRRAERALESLNRETKTARHVLDACLALVRSALARGDRPEALREATRCRRLVPDVAPSEFLHPPSVFGALADADEQLGNAPIGRLSVESVPESGCATFVNGRHLGVTPFTLERAAAGAYRVQVECSHTPGRVHSVTLGEQPIDLRVDSVLDHALRDDGRVALVYESREREQALAQRHAAELARDLRAEQVVLVSVREAALVLTQIDALRGQVTARVVHPDFDGDLSATQLADALNALQQGRIDSDAVEAPPPIAEREDSVAPRAPRIAKAPVTKLQHTSRSRRASRIASAGLAGVGLALFALGSSFEHKQRATERDINALDPARAGAQAEFVRLGERYQREGAVRWIALGGSALVTAAVPLARVDVHAAVPWWSYALGAVGAGLATWGAVELARDNRCQVWNDDDSCAHFGETSGRGGLILAGAAPLMAVPITHLIAWKLNRRAERPTTVVGVVPRPAGALVTLRKELAAW